jgi:lysophospholipid acyltransferase
MCHLISYDQVFFFVMTYMSLSHLYRVYVDYLGWSLDFTGPQMILTIKLSSFAYNVYDGSKHSEEEAAAKDLPARKKATFEDRKRFAIAKLPSLLEFYGYGYCFTTFLAGPAFEFSEYQGAIEGTVFPKYEKPGSIGASLFRLLQVQDFPSVHVFFIERQILHQQAKEYDTA